MCAVSALPSAPGAAFPVRPVPSRPVPRGESQGVHAGVPGRFCSAREVLQLLSSQSVQSGGHVLRAEMFLSQPLGKGLCHKLPFLSVCCEWVESSWVWWSGTLMGGGVERMREGGLWGPGTRVGGASSG